MSSEYQINKNIHVAETLPAEFYRNDTTFNLLKEEIFCGAWQFIGTAELVPFDGYASPFILLDRYLTEPMVLVRNKAGEVHCYSNVCTHRGNLVVQNPGKLRSLVCGYHGRKFDLNGKFEFMPEFEEAADFPRNCEHLHEFPLEKWGPFLFAGLNPKFDFGQILEKMNERVGFLPLDEFIHDQSSDKEYLINAHWALYCDNYLEGFHIPFVHKDLNEALDYGSYKTELYPNMSLQIGYADDDVEVFDLPKSHPDYGKKVAAYYYWVFPNMMFNFYPWGLSINIVKPISLEKTKVQFISYIYDESKIESGAGALLDKVEREDEFVVEGVQKGLKSRFYSAGRYSPIREQGVHHFHRLICQFLNNE